MRIKKMVINLIMSHFQNSKIIEMEISSLQRGVEGRDKHHCYKEVQGILMVLGQLWQNEWICNSK